MRRPTVLLIPSPWSGDERDPIPWTYHRWFWLYCTLRRARHQLGIHDWEERQVCEAGSKPYQHCDWCGANRHVPQGT
jgi:hypothetical protein